MLFENCNKPIHVKLYETYFYCLDNIFHFQSLSVTLGLHSTFASGQQLVIK